MTLIIASALTGCAGKQNQPLTDEPSSSDEKVLTFNHELFTLDLPAPFEVADFLIKPIQEKDFPEIAYDVSQKTSEDDLLTTEIERQKNLCDQTSTCGEITESEEVTINNVTGIKFTVKYEGRGLDDQSGYILEYKYSLQNGGNLFRFWTSTNDLENPEDVKRAFEEVMGTIATK